MNDNAKKWVSALRSGNYTQTQGWLRNKDGYCCLGVACELFIEDGNALELTLVAAVNNVVYQYGGACEGSVSMLPDVVKSWLGLKTCAGGYYSTKADRTVARDTSLVVLNDDKNKDGNTSSFNDIANVIESEPDGLFA